MLVLKLKKDDYIEINDNIRIILTKKRGEYRIGIDAPADVAVLRKTTPENMLEVEQA